MNILVTGGAGMLGSHVADALLTAGHDVTILDDLSGGFECNVPTAAHFVKGSVCNHALVRFICSNWKFDAIYHFAAYAVEGLSHFIRKFNYENNVGGSINLINAAIENKVRKFIFTSSIAVYGEASPPFSEDASKIPIDPYGVAKLAVENDLSAAAHMFGLDYTIFRPHNIAGSRQHIGDKYRNVVGIFMNQTLSGQPLTIFGDGSQQRAFSYVGDVVQPFVDGLTNEKAAREAYNIGGREPITVLRLAELVQEVSGINTGIVFLPPRREVKHAFSDHAKLDDHFGPQRETPIREWLSVMWTWAKELGPQEALSTPAIEIASEQLPLSWR